MFNLSIVTVTFNNINELKKTFNSLTEQGNENFEWIVIDAQSIDKTPEWLKNIEPIFNKNGLRMKYISEPDNGIYDAMNKGISLSNGEFILFLNAGDTLNDSSVTEKLQSFFTNEKNNDCVIYGDCMICTEKGRQIYRKANNASYINYSLPTSHQAILYPRSFLKINCYDTSYKISGDYNLTVKCVHSGINLKKIPVCISKFHLGGVSYKKTFDLVKEMMRTQRDVLKMSIFRVYFFALIRLVKIYILKAINILG